MRLLDLFCGAGGAGMGYHRAGFEVVGVDIKPQPHYPFEFHQADALEYLAEHGREFDAIHASPPCQAFSAMTNGRWKDRLKDHPDLIAPTRALLAAARGPYVIENVVGAPLINPVMLCGTLFGLQTKAGSQLRRHRLFEIHPPLLVMTPQCLHAPGASAIGVYGGGQHPQRRRYPSTIGVYGHAGGTSKRDYPDMDCFTTNDRRDAMGIGWMTGKELSQAIPPAYTEFIGKHIMAILTAQVEPRISDKD
jgi:DNA (cytosine-5)-methyltransferase 1